MDEVEPFPWGMEIVLQCSLPVKCEYADEDIVRDSENGVLVDHRRSWALRNDLLRVEPEHGDETFKRTHGGWQ
jgi:hypothetical protein